MRQLNQSRTGPLTIGAIVELVRDPHARNDAIVDLTIGTRRPTSWMQRLRSGNRSVTVSAESGVPLFDGRACCALELGRYEGRGDIPLPFEFSCPTCERLFRVRLDVVKVRR